METIYNDIIMDTAISIETTKMKAVTFRHRDNPFHITRPNCALDRRTIFCRYFVSGFQGQAFKQGKVLSERSKKMKEEKKNERSVLVADSA